MRGGVEAQRPGHVYAALHIDIAGEEAPADEGPRVLQLLPCERHL